MCHPEIVSKHVRDCGRHQMGFVDVRIFADANCFRCTYRIWDGHADFLFSGTALCLTAATHPAWGFATADEIVV